MDTALIRLLSSSLSGFRQYFGNNIKVAAQAIRPGNNYNYADLFSTLQA